MLNVCVCVYNIYQTRQGVIRGQFLNGVQIQSFYSPRLVALPRLKESYLSYFPPFNWGENRCIPDFIEGISAKWNADNQDQDLNPARWFHFLLS